MGAMRKYLLNILIAIDQLGNTLLGGDPDETLSSRAAKWHPAAARVINVIFFWQPNHCRESLEADEGNDAVIK